VRRYRGVRADRSEGAHCRLQRRGILRRRRPTFRGGRRSVPAHGETLRHLVDAPDNLYTLGILLAGCASADDARRGFRRRQLLAVTLLLAAGVRDDRGRSLARRPCDREAALFRVSPDRRVRRRAGLPALQRATIDLPDASVDRVVCFDSFHHIPNSGKSSRNSAGVLKPGGIAGFSEPGRHHSTPPPPSTRCEPTPSWKRHRPRGDSGVRGVLGLHDLVVKHALDPQLTVPWQHYRLAAGRGKLRYLRRPGAVLSLARFHLRLAARSRNGRSFCCTKARSGPIRDSRSSPAGGAPQSEATTNCVTVWSPSAGKSGGAPERSGTSASASSTPAP